MVEQPLIALSSAIKARDDARFADLTHACNSCHEVDRVGFVRIQVPTAPPFGNKSFMPKENNAHQPQN